MSLSILDLYLQYLIYIYMLLYIYIIIYIYNVEFIYMTISWDVSSFLRHPRLRKRFFVGWAWINGSN
jgi:hypothetical protein